MADIKAVGTDVVTGASKPINGVDTLIVNNVAPTVASDLNITIEENQKVAIDLGLDSLNLSNVANQTVITGTGASSIFFSPGNAEATDTPGQTLYLYAGTANGDGVGGDVDIAAGTGSDNQNGNIFFVTDGSYRWAMDYFLEDDDWGTGPAIKGLVSSSPQFPAFLEGPDGSLSDGGTMIIRGGHGNGGGSEGGGNVYVTGGTAEIGGETGSIFIGTYLHTPNIDENGFTTGTTSITIGAQDNPTQTVEIYNFFSPNMQVGTPDNGTEPLMLLQNGYQTFGPNTGVVINVGPVYYDPNNGEIIRLGANSVYIQGNGTDNFVRGQDGDEVHNEVLATLGDIDEPYDLANATFTPASPMAPGTVTLRVLFNDTPGFQTVTDDGSGVFPAGSVLAAGGTVDYTTGALTGFTHILDAKTQVTLLYSFADGNGEPLTPRAGNATGVGTGGQLRLRAGSGGDTSGNGGSVFVTAGSATIGEGGSIIIEAGNGDGGNFDGGDITIEAGTPAGSGIGGKIDITTIGPGADVLFTVGDTFQISAEAINIGIDPAKLLGFYGTFPVDQAAAIPNATGGATVDAEARTAINALLAAMRALGLIAT